MHRVGLGVAGGTASTGGGRTQGVVKFLQEGGAGDSILWVGYMGPFGVNGKEGREDTHRVPTTDHGEESEAIRRWDMGDAGDRRCTRGIGNSVGEDLSRATSGNRGALGGATSLILRCVQGR